MHVLGAGLITADITQLCDADYRPLPSEPWYAGGGTVCNILCYLARFGWDCDLVGGVGSDELGDVVVADLATFGVGMTGVMRRSGAATRRFAHMIVATGPAERRQHEFRTECFRCGRDFVAFEPPRFEEIVQLPFLKNVARTVLLIDRANELTAKLAKLTAEGGGIVVFEPGYVSKRADFVEEIFHHVDVLKYSQELMWKGRRFAEVMPPNHPRLRLLIETRSDKGVRAVRGNREFRLTVTPITTWLDRAGAGDAFMAGFLTGMGEAGLFGLDSASHADIESAIERGQALGGLACLFLGSKGLLYSKTTDRIEEAIAETRRVLRTPAGFANDSAEAGTRLPPPPVGACPVCRLGS